VVVVVFAVLLVIGVLTGRGEERFEDLEQSYAIPDGASLSAPVPSRPPGAAAGAAIDHEIEVAEPGRVVLDLHRGNFEVRPGPAGEPVRLEGRYDAGHYVLTESYEPYGEAGWTYRVSFDRKGFGIRPFVEQEGRENRLRVVVPRGAPIVLEGRVGTGTSELELGGLWLIEIDLDIGVGEHAVSFGEPLPVPVGRLRLDGSIGVLDLDRVGNASPREVSVRHSIGEVGVDLGGAWRRDAEVLVSCGIGECGVRVPRGVNVELERASVMLGEASRAYDGRDRGGPTLKLSVSGRIGEVRVH
jgi:hypothetical protein